MYENKRSHYRVAKRNILEDPYEGIYVTREEQSKYFFLTIGLALLSFLCAITVILKKTE